MKQFIKNNEEFTCFHCNKLVEKHPTSSRDHCNHCLYGLHVDINPGDRMNDCKGALEPIGLKIANGKTQIAYKCQKCQQQVFCIKADDDNAEEIINLGKKVWTN